MIKIINPTQISLHKEFTFDSSHRLNNPTKSEKWNKEVYGKCHNNHGHLFKMVVGLSGLVDEDTGFICNFVEAKKLINELIIDKLDHHFINEVSFMKGKVVTCENLVEEIWRILDNHFITTGQNYYLKTLTIYETPTSSIIKEVRESDIAWLSGFLDGDGSISLLKAGTHAYEGRIEFYNTDKRPLKKASLLVGRPIKVDTEDRGNPNRKLGYHVTTYKLQELKHFLIKLFPYLVEKREQAEVLLMYVNERLPHIGKHYTSGELKRYQKLYSRMKQLNKLGK
jgi:6-pyruvoyltetrahydropterin/6-carboxytetrahydropterin synthase